MRLPHNRELVNRILLLMLARCRFSAPWARNKKMKRDRLFVLTGPLTSAAAGKPWWTSFWRVSCRLTVCGALMPGWGWVHGGDALPGREPDTQAMQARQPAYVPQGYQMGRYKVFARQTQVPPITVTNRTVLKVGEVGQIDTARLTEVSPQQRQALAEQLKVPSAVIDRLVQQLAQDSPSEPDRFAREMRTAVIDYRFLQIEWERYHPPAEGQPTKTAALEALQSGNFSKAWALYDRLQRPQAPGFAAPAPPANLRVIAQP